MCKRTVVMKIQKVESWLSAKKQPVRLKGSWRLSSSMM
jgi:hypothetical protein